MRGPTIHRYDRDAAMNPEIPAYEGELKHTTCSGSYSRQFLDQGVRFFIDKEAQMGESHPLSSFGCNRAGARDPDRQ